MIAACFIIDESNETHQDGAFAVVRSHTVNGVAACIAEVALKNNFIGGFPRNLIE